MKSYINKTAVALGSLFIMVFAVSLTLSHPVLADPQLLQQIEDQSSSSSTPATQDNCDKVSNSSDLKKCVNNNQIIKDLQAIVNFLSAAVAIIVVAMIIVGGIQYTLAGDNPAALTAARKRISNALIALFALLLMFAFLQWLIPGGIFG
jgi:glutamine synthetase adenylyltransferase